MRRGYLSDCLHQLCVLFLCCPGIQKGMRAYALACKAHSRHVNDSTQIYTTWLASSKRRWYQLIQKVADI
jgi:hypothetical protein